MLQRDLPRTSARRFEPHGEDREPPPAKPGAVTRVQLSLAEAAAPHLQTSDEPRAARLAALLDRLEGQRTRLARALDEGDYFAARGAADTLRALAPTVRSVLREAQAQGDAEALALGARAEAQTRAVAPLLEQAPTTEPGLGIDLVEPSGDAERQRAWQAQRRAAPRPAAIELAPSHDGFEAAMDHRIPALAAAGKPLAALAYLHLHWAEARVAVGAYLATHLRDPGDPALRFCDGPGPFVSALLAPLRPDDASACIALLRDWLAPHALPELINRNRAITEAPLAGRVASYAAGRRGPATWSPGVATGIAAALLERLSVVLPRCSRRLVALAGQRGDLSLSPADASALRRGAPLDSAVARALLGNHGAPTVERVAPIASTARARRPRGTEPPARGTSTPAPRGEWLRVLEQLRALELVTTPHGLAGTLTGAIARHAARAPEFEHLRGDHTAARAEAFSQTRALLAELAAEVGAIAATPPAELGEPGRRALRDLLAVAALSHDPARAREALTEARSARRGGAFASVEAMLGKIATALAHIRTLRAQTRSAEARGTALLGASMHDRLTALQLELGEHHGRAVAGTAAEPTALAALLGRAEDLRSEAEVVLQIGALGGAFEVLDQLEDSGWVLFTEAVTSWASADPPADLVSSDGGRIGRLEALRVGASQLRAALSAAHARWMRVEGRARALAPALADPKTAAVAGIAALELRAELLAARAQLAELGRDDRVRRFLEHAAATAKSAQRRAMISKIVALLGLMVASGSAAAAAEGVAAGAGAGALTSQLIGLGAETLVFGVLDARLSETPIARQLVTDFAGNLATFGAMRATKALFGAKHALDAGEHVARGVAWAAKAGEVTATMVAAAGVSFASAQAQSLRARGRPIGPDELSDLAAHGMAMMIGGAVLHHGMTRSLSHLSGVTKARAQQLTALAKRVAARGNPDEALELLRGLRAHLETLAAPDAAGAARAAAGRPDDAAHRAAAEQLARLDRLEAGAVPAQLALETVVPGQVFAGTAAQLAPVLDSYRARGHRIIERSDGFDVVHPQAGALRFLRRAAEPAAASAASAAHSQGPTPPAASAPTAEPARVAVPEPSTAAARGAEPTARDPHAAEGNTDAKTTAPMAAIDPIALELARIRSGTPGRVRDVLALNDDDTALALNHQLRAVTPEQLGEVWATFPAEDRAAARVVLARSSGFANLESWNALVTAMQPHLAAGKRLYLAGQGSLADNLSYTASKGQYTDLVAGLRLLRTTSTLGPEALVILDRVVLHRLRADPAFAQALVTHRCLLIEPKGMVSGINLYNSPDLAAITRRTQELLQRARLRAATDQVGLEQAIDAVLSSETHAALTATAPELAGAVEVVDAAAHREVSDAALARQLSGDAGITGYDIGNLLEPMSEPHRALARELLVHQAEVYSPRRFADELARSHTDLMARARELGVAADHVYFYIPQAGKSYGMLAMAHREATGTAVDRYLDGPADLKARKLPSTHLLIVLDDVAGSGHSLEDAATDIQRTGFSGRVLISPMVSTEVARDLFEDVAKVQPGLEYRPRAMSRALEESFFYKGLQDADQQILLNELISHAGYDQNALSLAFPYMAPDNNNALFGDLFAQFFIANKNKNASKARTYQYPSERDPR